MGLFSGFVHSITHPGKAFQHLIHNPASALVPVDVRNTNFYKNALRPATKAATGALEGFVLSGGNPFIAAASGAQGLLSGGYNSPFKPLKNIGGPAVTAGLLSGASGLASELAPQIGGTSGSFLSQFGNIFAPQSGSASLFGHDIGTYFGHNLGGFGQFFGQGGAKLGRYATSLFTPPSSSGSVASRLGLPSNKAIDALLSNAGNLGIGGVDSAGNLFSVPGIAGGSIPVGAGTSEAGGGILGTIQKFAKPLGGILSLFGGVKPQPQMLADAQLAQIKQAETQIAQAGLAPAIHQLMADPNVQKALKDIADQTRQEVGAMMLNSYGQEIAALGTTHSSAAEQMKAHIADVVTRAIEQKQLAYLMQLAANSTNSQINAIRSTGGFAPIAGASIPDKTSQIAAILTALGG